MAEAIRASFTVNAQDEAELLDRLLELNNFTADTFIAYMGIEATDLTDAPKWAINYLADLLDVELIHLGYVAKDAKHEGVFGEYDDIVKDYNQKQSDIGDLQQPIVINKEHILSSVRTLKVSLLTNSMKLIKNYIS